MARFRLLALDIDGTLLDRDGRLRARTRDAVMRAAALGIQPVICTGRRYRRALPIAQALGVAVPVICNSGALIKDPRDHQTIWRADLDPALVAELLRLLQDRDEFVISFIDESTENRDFFAAADPCDRPLADDYLSQNRPFGMIDPDWMSHSVEASSHYHICAIGDSEAMTELRRVVENRFPSDFTLFVQRSPRYKGTMCEVMRHDANKWSALLHLAKIWGIAACEIVAVGDDVNDVPMLSGAGLGVAMGHAPAEVKAVANMVTLDEQNDGLARLIEDHLLNLNGRPEWNLPPGSQNPSLT